MVAAFGELAANVQQASGKVARLIFPATADAEEVLSIFAESGEFDIFQGEGKRVRRLA